MSRLDDAEKIIAELSGPEKAELLRRIVEEMGGSFPGIDITVDVCGGAPVSSGCQPTPAGQSTLTERRV